MVRLEASIVMLIRSENSSFNSYMVRLEVLRTCKLHRTLRVSIPIWCDWKDTPEIVTSYEQEFQFLYGAIGSGIQGVWVTVSKCFNSYMVRLEVWRFILYSSESCLFQFLYGAIGRNGIRTITEIDLVSIPIWCDWKERHPYNYRNWPCFNSYMVRLEAVPGSSANSRMKFQFLYGAIGSYNGRDFFMTITLFQFLYGAIGRNNRSDNNFGKRCFNSYMVRLEGYAFLLRSFYR